MAAERPRPIDSGVSPLRAALQPFERRKIKQAIGPSSATFSHSIYISILVPPSHFRFDGSANLGIAPNPFCPYIKCITGRTIFLSLIIQRLTEENAFHIIKNVPTHGSVQSQLALTGETHAH